MECVLNQFVKEVTDFSSQYGSDGSLSYIAANVTGRSTLYPDYGDFSAAFNLRCYNTWWEDCPSGKKEIKSPPQIYNTSQSFIDCKYETAVYPIRVDIYETYHPGTVIRVWGSFEGRKWKLLWYDGCPQLNLPKCSRIFSPPIQQINQLINMLRIEFDQRHQDYYSGIDCIVLVGSTHSSAMPKGALMEQVMKLGFHNHLLNESTILDATKYILSDDFQHMKLTSTPKLKEKEIHHKRNSIIERESSTDTSDRIEGGYFALLPAELITKIIRFLDLTSICNLSQTSKFMKNFTLEPFIYMKLNLKNYWWMIKDSTLEFLICRCSKLQEFDLSWCGSYGLITTEMFLKFINGCGHKLVILRLDNCQFVDSFCLYMIANVCTELQELSLANCLDIDHLGFGELKKITGLKRLDLSRTKVDQRTLACVLQYATQLQHLNIHNCLNLDLDEVAITVSRFNTNLISFGAWKTRNLTPRGIKALSSISTLQDLDLGWSISGIITESLGELLRNCPNLKRLYLTALRTITDQDLNQISLYGKQLVQLDIMGTRNITTEAVFNLMSSCKNLRLLDLSFCEQIFHSSVVQWEKIFPNISIKGGLKHQVRII